MIHNIYYPPYGTFTPPQTAASAVARLDVKSIVEAVGGASQSLQRFVCVGSLNYSSLKAPNASDAEVHLAKLLKVVML